MDVFTNTCSNLQNYIHWLSYTLCTAYMIYATTQTYTAYTTKWKFVYKRHALYVAHARSWDFIAAHPIYQLYVCWAWAHSVWISWCAPFLHMCYRLAAVSRIRGGKSGEGVKDHEKTHSFAVWPQLHTTEQEVGAAVEEEYRVELQYKLLCVHQCSQYGATAAGDYTLTLPTSCLVARSHYVICPLKEVTLHPLWFGTFEKSSAFITSPPLHSEPEDKMITKWTSMYTIIKLNKAGMEKRKARRAVTGEDLILCIQATFTQKRTGCICSSCCRERK